jgi:uncharacterized membrane protein YsdA (DUF1294 family)
MLKKLFGWLLVLTVVGVVVYALFGCAKEPAAEQAWRDEGE